MNKYISKFIAWPLAVIFLFQSCMSGAQVVSVKGINAIQNSVNDNNLFAGINIPEQYGTIDSSKFGSSNSEGANSNTKVVLIRDAHCNYEAQQNISKILETLIREYKVDLICVEGAEGLVDTSSVVSNPDQKVREIVSDKYLKKGYLSASEALSVAKGKNLPFTIYGVENTMLYLENFKEFRNTITNLSETKRYIEIMQNVINQLKIKIYNGKLKEFDEVSSKYKEEKLSLTEWVEYSLAYDTDRIEHINICLVAKAIDIEKRIDFNKVEQDRASLIKELEKKLTKEDLKELIQESLLYKLGKISSLDYYKYLDKYLRIYSMRGVSHLHKYIHLLKLQSKINHNGLFDELGEFENNIRNFLYQNDTEKQLNNIDENIRIANKFYSLSLTRKDLKYYKEHKEKFSPSSILPFIIAQANICDISIVPELRDKEFIDKIDKSILPAEHYYELAIKRDDALVNNLLERMTKDNKAISVIVAGGFHSDGIAQKLKDKDVSYAVITPKITKTQGNELYMDLMMDNGINIDLAIEKIGNENLSQALSFGNTGKLICPWRVEEIETQLGVKLTSAQKQALSDGDLKEFFTGNFSSESLKEKILAERNVLAKSFLIDLLKTALEIEGKKQDEISRIVSEISSGPERKIDETILVERVFSGDEFRTVDLEELSQNLWNEVEKQLQNYPLLYRKIKTEFIKSRKTLWYDKYEEKISRLDDSEVGDINDLFGDLYNHIRFMLGELLNNSFDAIVGMQGTTIAVRIGIRDDNFFIEISDTGSGIPESVLGKLFSKKLESHKAGNSIYHGGVGEGLYNIGLLMKYHGMNVVVDTKAMGDDKSQKVQYPADESQGQQNQISEGDRKSNGTTITVTLPGEARSLSMTGNARKNIIDIDSVVVDKVKLLNVADSEERETHTANIYDGNGQVVDSVEYQLVYYMKYDSIGQLFASKNIAGAYNLTAPNGVKYIFVEVSVKQAAAELTEEQKIAVQHEELELYWMDKLKGEEFPKEYDVARVAHILAWGHQILLQNWHTIEDSSFVRNQIDKIKTNPVALRQIANEFRLGHKSFRKKYLRFLFSRAQLRQVNKFEESVRLYAKDVLNLLIEQISLPVDDALTFQKIVDITNEANIFLNRLNPKMQGKGKTIGVLKDALQVTYSAWNFVILFFAVAVLNAGIFIFTPWWLYFLLTGGINIFMFFHLYPQIQTALFWKAQTFFDKKIIINRRIVKVGGDILRSILFHEWVHLGWRIGIFRTDIIARSVELLRLAELKKEIQGLSGEQLVEILKIKRYSQEFIDGYNAMQKALVTGSDGSILKLIPEIKPSTWSVKENYSLSTQLGGMAVALYQSFPYENDDATGGIAWKFLRDVGQGVSLDKVFTSIKAEKSLQNIPEEISQEKKSDIIVVPSEKLEKPDISFFRAIDHSFEKWKGKNVFYQPLYVSDHLILLILVSLSYIPAIFIGVIFGMPFVYWAVLLAVASVFVVPHFIEVKDSLIVSQNAEKYKTNIDDVEFDKEVISLIEEFKKETGWEVVYTDSTELLIQPKIKSKKIILSIGFIVKSKKSETRRMKLLAHYLNVIQDAIPSSETPSQAAKLSSGSPIVYKGKDPNGYIFWYMMKSDRYKETVSERQDQLEQMLATGWAYEMEEVHFIIVDGLQEQTGQLFHIGQKEAYGYPVIYIDNKYANVKVVENYALGLLRNPVTDNSGLAQISGMSNEMAGLYILGEIMRIDLYSESFEGRQRNLAQMLQAGSEDVFEFDGVPFIVIEKLYENTGQLAHIGLGQTYGRPVVYIDKRYAKSAIVRGHEIKEIKLWQEALNEELKDKVKSLNEIRQWMRENLAEAVALTEKFHSIANREFNVDNIASAIQKPVFQDGVEELPIVETPSVAAQDISLKQTLIDAIDRSPDRKINFKDFMQLALYSRHGYYSEAVQIGKGQKFDFHTYAEEEYFAECMGRQLIEMWELMEKPDEFSVVEMGAGTGKLARNILRYLLNEKKRSGKEEKALYDSIKYIIVEISPSLQLQQKEALKNFDVREHKVEWVGNTALDLSELKKRQLIGVFLSNELVDEFPVHRVVRDKYGNIREVYVTYEDGQFKDVLGDISDPRIFGYLSDSGIKLRPGQEIAVNLDISKWQREISESMKEGFVLTVDYSDRLTVSASNGSVWSGAENDNILVKEIYEALSGNKALDITVLVDFEQIEREGSKVGFMSWGAILQRDFIFNLYQDELIDAKNWSVAHDLNFKVLIQAKGERLRDAGEKIFILNKMSILHARILPVVLDIQKIVKEELHVEMSVYDITKMFERAFFEKKNIELKDILRRLRPEYKVEPARLVSVGMQISALSSLEDLAKFFGRDVFVEGGNMVRSILNELIIEIGGETRESVSPVDELRNKLLDVLGMDVNASIGVFELVQQLLYVIEYDPDLRITKVNSKYYELLKVISDATGLGEEGIQRVFERGILQYQIEKMLAGEKEDLKEKMLSFIRDKTTKEKLIQMFANKSFYEILRDFAANDEMDKDISFALSNFVHSKGLSDSIKRVKVLLEDIKQGDVEKASSEDTPFDREIEKIRFYAEQIHKTGRGDVALSELELDMPRQLYENLDFPESVVNNGEGKNEDNRYISGVDAVSNDIQKINTEFESIQAGTQSLAEVIRQNQFPIILNIPAEQFINWNKAKELSPDVWQLSHMPGLKVFLNYIQQMNPNVRIILRISGMDERIGNTSKGELLKKLIKLAKLEKQVFVEEQFQSPEELINHSQLKEGYGIKGLSPENIIYFVNNELSLQLQDNPDINEAVRSNRLKVFGTDASAALHCMLMFGIVAASNKVFIDSQLSETIEKALALLGIDDDELDHIKQDIAKGTFFFNIKVIRLKDTLDEFRNRNIMVNTSA
jgi:SAM-dependent MidA family methyltransferase/signal transduction histidine kinase